MLSKNILSLDEAVGYLGVSRSFLYKLTSKGVITHSKPNGKLIYFKRENLDKWMLQNEIKSVDDQLREVVGNGKK